MFSLLCLEKKKIGVLLNKNDFDEVSNADTRP